MLVFATVLVLWEITTKGFQIQEWMLPGPLAILHALWLSKELIIYHSYPTIVESLLGLLIAIFVGVGTSIAMYWRPRFKKILYPFLIFSQTIPFIALAPILVIWFGFGILPKIIIIVLVCFFPITINIFDGFQSVDTNIIRFVISMGASKWQLFRFVIFPASLPSLFSGLRIAASYSVLGAVMSEWIGADRGLGILLIRSAKSYQIDRVMGIVAVISLLSVITVTSIEKIARISMPWYRHV